MMNAQLIVEECYKRLPYNLKTRPWEVTNHGRAILQTDDQLNAYLAAYGETHIIKCRAAIQNLPLEHLQHFNYEILDWGCGQGIASLVLIDYLRERKLLGNLQQITLVEPSIYALQRAEKWVKESAGPGIKIKVINKLIPSTPVLDLDDVICSTRVAINLFSNILDVQNISLKWLASKTASLADINYMICIGPKFSYNTRIKDFCGYFKPTEYFSNIEAYPYGYTTRTHHPFGCETKCFIHNKKNELNSQYQESAETTTQYDEYDFTTNYYQGILDDEVINLYAKLIPQGVNPYDVFIRPTIGVDKPDFIVSGITKGIIILNICSNINDLDIVWQRLDKLKSFLIETHLKNIKIDTIIDKRVYGNIKIAVYFPTATESDVNEYINQMGRDDKYLIKLYSNDNIYDKINRIQVASFKNEYYKELIHLIIGEWHSYTEGDTNFHLSTVQREIVKNDSRRIRVKGVAGSGKTQVVANKAVERHIKTGSKVLILTYNISLIEYIKMRINQVPADFSTSMFEITNYHQFFKSMANRYANHPLNQEDFDNPTFFETCKNNIEKYHSIIIDEAQDFEDSWFESIIKYFLADDGCIAIFGDGEQNIYNREYEKETKMPKIYSFNGPWREMSERISYRMINPQIANIASLFVRTFMNNENIPLQTSNEIIFDSYITKYWNIGEISDVNIISNKINEIIHDYDIPSKEITILSNYIHILREIEYSYRNQSNTTSMLTFETREQYEQLRNENNDHADDDIKDIRRVAKVHFTTMTDDVKFASIQSFKGWESNTIILIIPTITQLPHDNIYCVTPKENINALIYTAITRARQNLFVINLGNSQYDSFFQSTIK